MICHRCLALQLEKAIGTGWITLGLGFRDSDEGETPKRQPYKALTSRIWLQWKDHKEFNLLYQYPHTVEPGQYYDVRSFRSLRSYMTSTKQRFAWIQLRNELFILTFNFFILYSWRGYMIQRHKTIGKKKSVLIANSNHKATTRRSRRYEYLWKQSREDYSQQQFLEFMHEQR